MPGFEIFDESEKEQINEVMDQGFTFVTTLTACVMTSGKHVN
jgi:hypothetical protein